MHELAFQARMAFLSLPQKVEILPDSGGSPQSERLGWRQPRRLTGVPRRASRGYDDDGLLTSVGNLTLTRDPANGLPTGTSVGTGAGAVSEIYGYDAFGQLTSYLAKVGAKAAPEVHYARDALRRIARRTETLDDTATVYDYGYDAANRLAEVKKDGGVMRRWAYDADGNRTSATEGGATVNATYDAQDRLLTYGATGAGPWRPRA